MNYILSELSWIKKGLKGRLVTEQDVANELKSKQRKPFSYCSLRPCRG